MDDNHPSLERLRQLLDYNPETGVFTHLVTLNPLCRAGNVAGTLHKSHGYRYIGVENRRYKASRLAWLFIHGRWPVGMIDHKNGKRADDRGANLREATSSQNSANTKLRIDNKSGFKGVIWHKKANKWMAYIGGAKGEYLGLFDDAAEAAAVQQARSQERFGEFARAT